MTDVQSIILSRTDNIGDVILTLPMAGIIKEHFPAAKIIFLGRSYTEPVIRRSEHVDQFLNWENLDRLPSVSHIIHVFPNKEISAMAKKAKIPVRIATSHRLYHFFYCNKLVNLGRKNSNLHESLLNIKLLEPLGLMVKPDLKKLPKYFGWKRKPAFKELWVPDKVNLILHIKSKGSAKEWPVGQFFGLIQRLPFNTFHFHITGIKEEGELIKKECPGLFDLENITDHTGKFSLEELISFIEASDGLIGASTGPLHISSAAGNFTLGLYPAKRPMHAGRWAPIGTNAYYLSEKKPYNKPWLEIPISEVEKVVMAAKKIKPVT